MKSAYQKDILGRLLLSYLNGNANSSLVLSKLWLVNPDFLVKSMLEMYGTDATTLSRILDIIHELKVTLFTDEFFGRKNDVTEYMASYYRVCSISNPFSFR